MKDLAKWSTSFCGEASCSTTSCFAAGVASVPTVHLCAVGCPRASSGGVSVVTVLPFSMAAAARFAAADEAWQMEGAEPAAKPLQMATSSPHVVVLLVGLEQSRLPR